MPEQFDDYRRPEQLLAGSDRPRPLSPALRARLESSLVGLSEGGAVPVRDVDQPRAAATALPPRPLSPAVRDRLEYSLRRPVRPGQRGNRPRRNWKHAVPGAGLAAAIAILAAIVVPQLVHSPSRPGGTLAAKAAAPSSARPRLSPQSSAVSYGPSVGKAKAAPARGPSRPKLNRFAPGPARVTPGTVASGTAAAGTAVPATVAPAPVVPRRLGTTPAPLMATVEAPVVSGVSPRHGPAGGGNWVVVTGQGFVGISAVDFGARSTVNFAFESPVSLKVRAPAHAAGTVDVVVVGPAGRSDLSALDRYTFDR